MMGPQEDYIETVVTCEGNFYDPEFHSRLEDFSKRLQDLIETGQRELIVKKVEPWNSVRVTFNIPKEAAVRLKQLAESGSQTLREIGVLAVQVEGDRLISLTIAGKNNERTEVVLQTTPGPPTASASSSVFDLPSSDELGVPGPSNVETTRKNIVQYLQDGPAFKNLFNPTEFLEKFKPPESVGAAVAAVAAAQDAIGKAQNHPIFGKFPFSMPGHPHPAGLEQFPFPPGSMPSGFPSPSMVRSHTFTSPTVSHNHSPHSPNYPTPPPSVSNPSSPGLRTANFPVSLAGTNSALLSNLPRLLGNRDITSSSPLLVNLLQNDVGHLNNFMPPKLSGMPFPPLDIGPPPTKKRRKPRKPKDGASKGSKPPAGQEPLGGFPSFGTALQGIAAGQTEGAPSTLHPSISNVSDQQSSDTSGQQMSMSQEPPINASCTSQSNSSTTIITSADTLMTPAQINSPLRMQSPSRSSQSPGRAMSPRAQSPVRSQSPARTKSPGAFMVGRGPGNNPQHIVNPVTGQLEPAPTPDMVHAARARGLLKEPSVDNDDMAHTQLQPPPNPLVVLQKNIAASTDSVAVSSLSAVSSRQSSPLHLATPRDVGPSVCADTFASIDPVRSVSHTIATPSMLSHSVQSISRNLPASQLVLQSAVVSTAARSLASTLPSAPNSLAPSLHRGQPCPSTATLASSNSLTTFISCSPVSTMTVSGSAITALSTVVSHVGTSVNSVEGSTVSPASVVAPVMSVNASNATPASFPDPQLPLTASSSLPLRNGGHVGHTTGIMATYNPSLPLPVQHRPSSPSTTSQGNPAAQPALATSTTAAEDTDVPMLSTSTVGAIVDSQSAILTVVSSGMTGPLMTAGPLLSNPVVSDSLPVTNVLEPSRQIPVDSLSPAEGPVITSEISAVTSDPELCNKVSIANTITGANVPTSQEITGNGTLRATLSIQGTPVEQLNARAMSAVLQVGSSTAMCIEEPVSVKLDPADSATADQSPNQNTLARINCDEHLVERTGTEQLSNCKPTDLLMSQEDSGSPGINCLSNDPASINTSPDHEHCVTDGSDTSSLVAHSQGKDSGIADIGRTHMLGKLSYLDKGDERHSDTRELHTGRSNGASTSEATASPLSETDTVSSGHLSQSPSVRSGSVGLVSHDSELSSHSFEDQNHENCLVPNVHGSSVDEGVKKLSNATSNHGPLKDNMADSQSKMDVDRHGATATSADTSAVITVGYALSRDHPSVNLSQSGLSDKSLPFLTKPSNPFTKESSIGLEGYMLSERFHPSSKAAAESLNWSSKKDLLACEESRSSHSNTNGDLDNKDYLNWSKTLNLPPKLLGRTGLTPNCMPAKVGASKVCEVGTETGVVVGSGGRSLNGDSTGLHSPESLYSSLSLDPGVSALISSTPGLTKCSLALKDTKKQSNHAHGILPVNNVTVQINSGLEKAFKQENHTRPLSDVTHSLIDNCQDTGLGRFPGGGCEAPGAVSVRTGTQDIHRAQSPPSVHDPIACCVGNTSPSSVSTLSPTSDTSTVSALDTTAAMAQSEITPVLPETSCPWTLGVTEDTARSQTPADPPAAPRRQTPPADTCALSQQTLANTFGASMVTAVITSTVPMGSAFTVTSFSGVGSHPSTAMTPSTCIPRSSPTSIASTMSVMTGVCSLTSTTATARPTEHSQPSAAPCEVTAPSAQQVSPVVQGSIVHRASSTATPLHAPTTVQNTVPKLSVRATGCPNKSLLTVSELLAHRSNQNCAVNVHQSLPDFHHAILNNNVESPSGTANLFPVKVSCASGPVVNDLAHRPLQSVAVSSCSTKLVPTPSINCVSVTSQLAAASVVPSQLAAIASFPEVIHAREVLAQPPVTEMSLLHHETSLAQHVPTNSSNVVVSEPLSLPENFQDTTVGQPAHPECLMNCEKDSELSSVRKDQHPHVTGLQPLDSRESDLSHSINHHGSSKQAHPEHAVDRLDTKFSRGISIMKPLYDRDFEIEEELHAQVLNEQVKKPLMTEINPNPLPVANISKAKVQPTVAQILEEADKVRRSQAQIKPNALLIHKLDGMKHEVNATGDATFNMLQGRPAKLPLAGAGLLSSPASKIQNSSFDLSRSSHSHIANFVQKSLQTRPAMYNSTPHPITSPGFALNLTDSVQKIMNAIPRTDTTPPPPPVCNKLTTASVPPTLSLNRGRQKSVSPLLDQEIIAQQPQASMVESVGTSQHQSGDSSTVCVSKSIAAAINPRPETLDCSSNESAVSSNPVLISSGKITSNTDTTCSMSAECTAVTSTVSCSVPKCNLDTTTAVENAEQVMPEGLPAQSSCSLDVKLEASHTVLPSQKCLADSGLSQARVEDVVRSSGTLSRTMGSDQSEKDDQSGEIDQRLVETVKPISMIPELISSTGITAGEVTSKDTEQKLETEPDSEGAPSEHSYSARPPGGSPSPCKLSCTSSPSSSFVQASSALPLTCKPELTTVNTKENELSTPNAIAVSPKEPVATNCQSTISTQLTVDTATNIESPLSTSKLDKVINSPASKVVEVTRFSPGSNPIRPTDEPIVNPTIGPSITGGRLRVISPVSKITAGPRDDADGPRTLVIKIIGAHSASTKESPVVRNVAKPDSRCQQNQHNPTRISPIQHNILKESSVIDLPSLGKFQQVVEPDQSTSGGQATKRKVLETNASDSKAAELESSNCVSALNSDCMHETATDLPDEVSQVSASLDDIYRAAKKRRTPSCDAMSETSSVDMPVMKARPGGNTDHGESPLLRSTRMSTRNNGRRRNSPSDSSTDEKLVVTRANKRKVTSTDDDSCPGVPDKKSSKLEQAETADNYVDSTQDASFPVAHEQNDVSRSVSPSLFYNKIASKATPAKTPNKANAVRGSTPTPPPEDKNVKVRKPSKSEDICEALMKEETNGSKRGKAKVPNSIPANIYLEDQDQEPQFDDEGLRDDAVDEGKGKRTTRSSKNKEHCELPNALQGKRRRTSRDHR